jgi:hypothetical protein
MKEHDLMIPNILVVEKLSSFSITLMGKNISSSTIQQSKGGHETRAQC